MNPESILKGRMAESLVSEMLREAGNQVYRFGYESTLGNLTQVAKVFDGNTEIGEKIRSIPDLLVINKKGEPFFVEVKFRWNRDWHKNDYDMLKKLESFWKPTIIFVNCYSKPYFLLTKPPYYNRSLKKLSGIPLERAYYLDMTPSLVGKYDALVKKYLAPTLDQTKKLVWE